MVEWTKNELDFMRNNYQKIPIRETAEKLERSIPSIKSKARSSKGNYCRKDYQKPHLETCEIVESNFIKDLQE
jgi:hypothetical protein